MNKDTLQQMMNELGFEISEKKADFKGKMMNRIQFLAEKECSPLLNDGEYLHIPSDFFLSILIETKSPFITDEELMKLVQNQIHKKIPMFS